MSGFIERLDARFYPNESGAWDNARYRTLFAPLIKATDRVLDLGAGRGRIPEMNLKGLAGQVTGADPDPCVKENPYLDEAVVLTEPSRPLPFKDATYDVVITANVLEHLQEPVGMFSEVHRILKPGGLFISKTPNRGHYVALIASLTPHRFHEWVNHRRGRAAADTYPTFYRANSVTAIRRLATTVGFVVERAVTWEGPPNYLRIVPPLYPLGIMYERITNSSETFSPMRAVLVSVLRKKTP